MAVDLGRLLAPVSDEDPVGPDLAYDPVRSEIEQAFEIDISIDASGVESGPSDVDWRHIINLIDDQSAQTKDVWLAVYLCRAGALSAQFDVLETGAQYLAGLLEEYWPSVHPQLEEYGFQGRKGACDSLVSPSQFLNPLRRIKLLRHQRLGEYSGEDFERFHAHGDAEDGYGMFRAALADVADEGLAEIVQRLDAVEDGMRRTDLVLTSNGDQGASTNFQPLYDVLTQTRRAVLAFSSNPPEEEAEMNYDGDGYDAPAGRGGSSGGGPSISGRVETREDVIRALDAIGEYYRRREPSHPMPSLLQRAREWVGLDFMAILEDIAPGSVDEARGVLQSRRQREEY